MAQFFPRGKILSKYRVLVDTAKNICTMDPRDHGAHYIWDDFHNDAFVKDLKELVRSYFGAIAKSDKSTLYQAAKATSERWAFIGILALGFVTIFASGHYWTLLVSPPLAWVLVTNYWHDSLHFSLSTDWRINASLPYLLPIFSSPWMWYHEHVIGHHAYTNVAMKDPDIAHAPQLKREHESISWKKCHENQAIWADLLWFGGIATGLGLNVISDLKTNLKLSYNNVVGYNKLSRPRMFVHVLGRVLYIFVMFLWPFFRFPLLKAAIWNTIPNILFSCSFMINSQINHLTEECAHASDTNFLKHQVQTAQNFGCDSLFCFIFSGGLNYQIEHHMFPFVNHCHLPHLAPAVKLICTKHGVTYNEAKGYRDAFSRHMEHTLAMSKAPVTVENKCN